ncbi:MAG: aminotransferase [Planctomyces sp.]|nr:aminotransferase [Planctomyces sp.]
MSQTSRALLPFGTTIFTTVSRLAQRHNAVNLAQGFPDFDGPDFIKDAAAQALRAHPNQYAPSPGLPLLRARAAERFTAMTGLPADPESDVTVTAGCTEAIAACVLGLCNPGDRAVLIEPFYDSYRACLAMAGVSPVPVAVRPQPTGRFALDLDELRAAFAQPGPAPRLLLLNSPHNPTGAVFTRDELAAIADLCARAGTIVIADEVYDRLVYDPARTPHVPIASLPGMADRTVSLNSLGKTFSLTGWKIGWAVAPAALSAAVRAAHQFLTFAVATPLQHAAAEALRREGDAVPPLLDTLRHGRAELSRALADIGLRPYASEGTYFVLADHSALSARLGVGTDAEFCQRLITAAGVAAIPPSVFYVRPELGRPMARFAYCKRPETIATAVGRLRDWAARSA